jgi:hypothetical protein
MKRLLVSLLLAFQLPAFAGPPTEASLEKLFEMTRTESLLEAMLQQVEQSIRAGMLSTAQDRPLSPEQRRILEQAPARLAAALRQELNWSVLKPLYLQIYGDVLDQAEVDGMIAFYETPAGQATIGKMPMIMQRSMVATQERLRSLMPRVEAAVRETMVQAGLER